MKKGDIRTISIPNDWGEFDKIEARFLGAGQFARCFEAGGFVYSYVRVNERDSDYSKQAVAEFGSKHNPHVPQIERLGDYRQFEVYKTPLYAPLTAKSGEAWKQARILQEAEREANAQIANERKSFTGYERNNLIIDAVRSKLPESIIEALESINNACACYGDTYYMEFGRRNLKTDSSGNLVLLDVIFNASAINFKRYAS